MMHTAKLAIPLISLSLLAGCANLAPNYARPELPVRATVDGRSAGERSGDDSKTGATAQSFTQPEWQTLVTDARLRQVIELAIANNRDLRIAALNIEKARAQYRIEDAARYPAVDASGSGTSSRYEGAVTRKYSVSLGVSSYELDFFGRLQNLSDSALQSFLSSEATRRSARVSLVAEVANAWLTLATDQDLLRLSQETWDSRQKTLELTRRQQALGGASGLAVAQARASAETARGDVATYTSQVAQDRNALTLLVGTSVADTLLPTTGDSIGRSVATLLELPAGLSSDVLLQRPDIVAAEHTLIGAYADIGAARAAFFPSISLTGSVGTASSSLNNLFDTGTRAWSFIPTVTLPIFNASSLSASLKVAETERDIQVATYEKTVQTAFREVADALAERNTLNERMAAQQGEVDAYATSLRLSTERYRSGADSYLNVLDSQRSLYSAQTSLIALQLAEQSNRITLFKVLGGG